MPEGKPQAAPAPSEGKADSTAPSLRLRILLGGALLALLAAAWSALRYGWSVERAAERINTYQLSEGNPRLRPAGFAVGAGGALRAQTPDACLFIEEDFSDTPANCAQLFLSGPRASGADAVVLHYALARPPQGAAGEAAARGLIEFRPQETWVTWFLPEPASRLRLTFPAGMELAGARLQCKLRVPPRPLTPTHRVARLLLQGAMLFLALLLVQLLRPGFFLTAARLKTVLLLGLIPAAAVMLFLLPPFQGLDEPLHWRSALLRCRPQLSDEPALYGLPALLGAEDLTGCPDSRFDARRFREPVEDEPGCAPSYSYAYAGPAAYPAVAAVSCFFPRVTCVNEALLFYYLCRLLPLLLLAALLWYAHRRYELPFTALFFFSIPLVLQQCFIVSADAAINCGVLGLVLLYLWGREFRNRMTAEAPTAPLPPRFWAVTSALVLFCLALAAVKPVLAVFLVLPAMLLPLERLSVARRRWAWLGLAGAGALGAGLLLLAAGRYFAAEADCPEAAQAQWATLWTFEGAGSFLSACGDALGVFFKLRKWVNSAGWLDAKLSQFHLNVLMIMGGACLALDALRCAPACRRLWRTRRAELLTVAAVPLAVFLVTLGTMGMLLFIGETPPGATELGGFQVRYLFPALLLAFFLPLQLAAREAPPSAAPTPLPWTRLLWTAAWAFLPLFLAVRIIELAQDLLARYW